MVWKAFSFLSLLSRLLDSHASWAFVVFVMQGDKPTVDLNVSVGCKVDDKRVPEVNGVGELLRKGKDRYMAWINIAVLLPNDIVNSPLIFINLFVSANTNQHLWPSCSPTFVEPLISALWMNQFWKAKRSMSTIRSHTRQRYRPSPPGGRMGGNLMGPNHPMFSQGGPNSGMHPHH
jgi:hypothetical protein